MSAEEKERSSIAVTDANRRRFNEAKPYESMSADEFIEVLIERWEGRR